VTGRLLELAALSERDLDAWRELAARALEPNPFAEPDFVLPAADALDSQAVAPDR
jgi:hypothetical protein